MAEARLIVIDGYNVIHRAPKLKPGPGRTLREARTKLLNLLAWAVGSGEARFLVVFDGAETPGRDERSGRVGVRYSRPPESADGLIRRIVEEELPRVERLTVVTSDIEVARHARAMGADVSLSDLFLASILDPARGDDDEKPTALTKKELGGEGEKPTALTKKELEEWAELFRRRTAEEKTPEDEPG